MYKMSGDLEKTCETTGSVPNPSDLLVSKDKLGVGIYNNNFSEVGNYETTVFS